MARNPPWCRDELILALDLYFKINPSHISSKHPAVVELSELLQSLPIYPASIRTNDFRNPNGVYMKLCNFLRLDPSYQGVGLAAGAKLDEEVWEEFAEDKIRLAKIANIIRANHALIDQVSLEDEAEELPEGKILTRLHHLRERNPKLVKLKKAQVMRKTGKLACEVCGFDFEESYGEIGRGFAECHHTIPLHELKTSTKVKLSDLSILCANCHRMVHKTRPLLKVIELKKISRMASYNAILPVK